MEHTHKSRSSLFGRIRMGYLLVESQRLQAWERFAAEGLGLHVDRPDNGLLACRIDGHQRRLVVRQGPLEDVAAIGWQLDDEACLDELLRRLRARGIGFDLLEGAQAAQRGVECCWRITGPKGLATEFFLAPQLSSQPLRMQASGFVTGAGGMGHVAITTRRPQAMQAFWRDICDARLSDHIVERIDGVDLELSFLRLNERHHSVATAATRGLRLNPLRTQIHHVNFQAAALEDVLQGYQRCKRMGYAIANSVGQHPNDRELSFYVVSPSGFEVELGWNPIVVEEAGWQPSTYQGMSLWGHRPENLTLGHRLGRLGQGIRSLMHEEFAPLGVQG